MSEIVSETGQYHETDANSLVRILSIDDWGHFAVMKSGYRVKMIDGDEIEYEPEQDGVTSYPPVVVSVKPGLSPSDLH